MSRLCVIGDLYVKSIKEKQSPIISALRALYRQRSGLIKPLRFISKFFSSIRSADTMSLGLHRDMNKVPLEVQQKSGSAAQLYSRLALSRSLYVRRNAAVDLAPISAASDLLG